MTRVARALVNLPERARANELVRVRALIAHPMETGYRPGADGRALPRDILRRFTCHCDDELVVDIALHPALAANPYLAFTLRVSASATLRFTWEGDRGFSHTEIRRLEVA